MNIIARVARSGMFIFILIFRVIVRREGELVLVFQPLCSPPERISILYSYELCREFGSKRYISCIFHQRDMTRAF